MNQKVVDLTPTAVIQHGIEFKKVRGYQRKPLNYLQMPSSHPVSLRLQYVDPKESYIA